VTLPLRHDKGPSRWPVTRLPSRTRPGTPLRRPGRACFGVPKREPGVNRARRLEVVRSSSDRRRCPHCCFCRPAASSFAERQQAVRDAHCRSAEEAAVWCRREPRRVLLPRSESGEPAAPYRSKGEAACGPGRVLVSDVHCLLARVSAANSQASAGPARRVRSMWSRTCSWRNSGLSRAPGAWPAFRCARYRNDIDRKRPLSRHRLCVGEVAAKPASPASRHRATTQRRPGSSGHSPRASSSRSASGCCAPSASATSEPPPRRSARAGSTKLASRTPRNATPSPQSPTSSAAEYAHFGCAHAVLRVRSQRRSGRYARSWSWRSSHQRAHWV